MLKTKRLLATLLRSTTQHFGAIVALLALLATAYQAYVTRDQEKQQLRAYLFVMPRVADFTVGKQPVFSVVLKNGGETPAYNPIVKANYLVAPRPLLQPLPTTLMTLSSDVDFIYQNILILNMWDTGDNPLSQTQYDSVMTNGQRVIYIFGTVRYSDTFHDTRHTNFCFILGPVDIANHRNFGFCKDQDFRNEAD